MKCSIWRVVLTHEVKFIVAIIARNPNRKFV